MKRILTLTAMAITLGAGSPALAGGMADTGNPPPLIIPLEPTWGGFYGGMAYSRTEAERTITETVDVYEEGYGERPTFGEQDIFEDFPIYGERPIFGEQGIFEDRPIFGQEQYSYFEEIIRELSDSAKCASPGANGSHDAYKCKFNQKTGSKTPAVWAESREIQALTQVRNPWDNPNYRRPATNTTRDPVRYDAGYKGIWLGDEDFVYTYNYRNVTEQVERTGVRTVQTGTETVKVGTETVQTGVESVQVGTETVKVGTETVQTGVETFSTGPVKVGEHSFSTTVSTNSDTFGVFAGYRHDFGRVIGGVEANLAENMQTIELQAGLDGGRVLPYGFVGAGSYDDVLGGGSGMVYGLGTDIRVGNSGLLVGVKYTAGEFDDIRTGTTSLRVGWSF